LERQGPALLLFLILASQFVGLDVLGWFMNPLQRFFYWLILGW
jgi:hypothetical protein